MERFSQKLHFQKIGQLPASRRFDLVSVCRAEIEALKKELADKKEIIELLKDKISLLEGNARNQQTG